MVATLKDIANLAGVSANTVSRALKNHSNIGTATKVRIKAIADELGYIPNSTARSLRGGKSSCIGIVIPPSKNDCYINRIVQIQQAVAARGYTCKVFMTELGNIEEQNFLINEINGLVDGLICSSISDETGGYLLKKLDNIGIKYIFTKYTNLPGVDWVSINYREAGYLATSHLIKQGHTRISTFSSPEDEQGVAERLQGYQDAMNEYGLSQDNLVIKMKQLLEFKDGYNLTMEMLNLTPQPTALFMRSDFIALAALRAIADIGLKPGSDIAVVGMDNIDSGKYSIPSLTTIDCDLQKSAELLCDKLISRIKGNKKVAENIWLQPSLIERESSAARIAHGKKCITKSLVLDETSQLTKSA